VETSKYVNKLIRQANRRIKTRVNVMPWACGSEALDSAVNLFI
jgi:hypothetical protein